MYIYIYVYKYVYIHTYIYITLLFSLQILSDFEPAYDAVCAEYKTETGDALPLFGVGHSAGCVLHALICSAFKGTLKLKLDIH